MITTLLAMFYSLVRSDSSTLLTADGKAPDLGIVKQQGSLAATKFIWDARPLPHLLSPETATYSALAFRDRLE